MNRWGKKALRFYLAGNASGCHMPNMRDSKHRPLQMICRALLLAANHVSLHPFQHHKCTGKAGLMGQAQMSLQMVLRHEMGGFTGKFQVRRTA